MPLLSLRGYAKHRGVSLAAVQKAIKSGRIATTVDGQVDSVQADATWETRTRPGQKKRAEERAVVPAPEAPRADFAGGLDYFKARAIRESYLARLPKIEFEERTAKLVSRDEVQVAAFTKARTVRDSLLNLPDRLAPGRLQPTFSEVPVAERRLRVARGSPGAVRKWDNRSAETS